MNNVKTTAVILIILAGLVGSYLILKNPNSGVASSGSDELSDLGRQILSQNPIQWVEKAKEQISSAINSGSVDSLGSSNSSQEINFTDLVAKSMFGGMQEMLQSGDTSNSFNPDDPKNQEAIEKAIGGIKDPFSYYDLSINEKEIKIAPDNSDQSRMNYFEGVSVVISQNQTGAYKKPVDAVNKAILSGDPSDLKQLAETYKKLFNGFMSLSVPPAQFELHKKYLSFFKKAGIVYSGISDIQNDPVKASLFFEMVPDLINEEIEIRREYYKAATGVNI